MPNVGEKRHEPLQLLEPLGRREADVAIEERGVDPGAIRLDNGIRRRHACVRGRNVGAMVVATS